MNKAIKISSSILLLLDIKGSKGKNNAISQGTDFFHPNWMFFSYKVRCDDVQ